jgi:hypothetical protein
MRVLGKAERYALRTALFTRPLWVCGHRANDRYYDSKGSHCRKCSIETQRRYRARSKDKVCS